MLALFIDLYHRELQCTTELLVVPSCSSKDGWGLLQALRFSVACLRLLRDCEYILFERSVWEIWNRFQGFLDFLQHVIVGYLVWCKCNYVWWAVMENGRTYLRDSSIWVFVSRGNKNVGFILEFSVDICCFSGCWTNWGARTHREMGDSMLQIFPDWLRDISKFQNRSHISHEASWQMWTEWAFIDHQVSLLAVSNHP